MEPDEPGAGSGAVERSGRPDGDVARVLAREGIRGWVSRTGHALLRLPPAALLTGMAAAALAPVIGPAVAGAAGAVVLEALLQQFGQVGAEYLTSLLHEATGRARSHPVPGALTEETLRAVLRELLDEELSGERVTEARTAIATFIQGIDGVNEALQAARDSDVPDLARHLVRALDDLSRTASEFRVLHDDLVLAIDSIQRDTTYLRSLAQDTNDELRRMAIEFGWLRRMIVRGPGPGGLPAGLPERALVAGSVLPADADTGMPDDDVVPYRGLAPFEVHDAGWFYGREQLVVTLVETLRERLDGSMPLLVVGASGAGKSSVLRAGLIPELRNGGLSVPGSADWPSPIMTPGPRPLLELAVLLAQLADLPSSRVLAEIDTDPAAAPLIVRQALRAHAQRRSGGRTDVRQRRLILVIDQFEEVFTQCKDGAERKSFIDAVCAISRGSREDPPPALVAIGLHTSYVEPCTAHPELAPALRYPVIVGPMTRTELRDAIELPARQAGLSIAPGLTDTMLADIGAAESREVAGLLTYDPGELPLLAHALLETWRRREDSQLTVAAYHAAGGIKGALADTANRVYASLDGAGKEVAKRLLLHLARPDDAADTRRRMNRSALLAELPAADAATAAKLLDRLEKERLVIADAGNVQFAHEALLRYWPLLAGWLAEDRAWLREQQLLSEQAREWDARHRPDDLLPHGTRLAAIRDQLDADRRADLGELARDFVTAADVREARIRRSRRRRRATVIASVTAAFAMLSASLVVAAFDNAVASHQRALAQSGELVAEATQLRASNPEASLLLSLEAYRIRQTPEAGSSLLSAQADLGTVVRDLAGPGNAIAYDPAASLVAVAGQRNAVTVLTAPGGRPVTTLRGQSAFYAVAYSAAGTLLAGGEQDGDTEVWNAAGQRVRVLPSSPGSSVYAVAFDPRAPLLAVAGNDHVITLWDTRTWRRSRAIATCDTVNGLAISPDGTRLAAACSDQEVRVWALGAPRTPPKVLSGHTVPVRAVAFSASSALLASADDQGTIRLWDARTGQKRGVLSGSPAKIYALAFQPHGPLLASGGQDNVVRLWDVDTLTQAGADAGPANTVSGVAFSPDGHALATADADATVGFWHVVTPPPPGSPQVTTAVAVSPGATTIATAGNGPAIALWSSAAKAGYVALTLPRGAGGGDSTLGVPRSIALSKDGTVLAISAPDNRVLLWNTRTRAELRQRSPLTARSAVTSLAYHTGPGGPVIAAGSQDGDVSLWALDSLRGPGAPPSTTIRSGLPAQVTAVALSPDGNLLAAGCADGNLLLASRDSAGRWTTFEPHGGPAKAIDAVAFTADGKTLATGSADGTVQLWDVRVPGSAVTAGHPLTGPNGTVIGMAFSDGGTLAAAASDGSVDLWDTRDPAAAVPLGTLSGLANPTSVTWRPGTQVLVGAATDATPLNWDTNPGDIARRICLTSNLAATAPALLASYLQDIAYQPICP